MTIKPFKRALKALSAAPPPFDINNPTNDRTAILMLRNTYSALADVCDKLHRKREAEHYRRSALMLLPNR
jgi:hypothetical protein